MLPSILVQTHECLNLQEEIPMIIYGPDVVELDSSTAPFFVTLVTHDLLLHNYMLESGASHNLIPLAMMEQLILHITRPYKDL